MVDISLYIDYIIMSSFCTPVSSFSLPLQQALKCNFGQGYFYDKPMSAKEFSQRYMKKDEK